MFTYLATFVATYYTGATVESALRPAFATAEHAVDLSAVFTALLVSNSSTEQPTVVAAFDSTVFPSFYKEYDSTVCTT